MRAETFEFLRSLLNTPTPSGFEAPGQRVWSDYARRFADEVRSDKYGNTIAVVNAGARPKIVLDGHCDEIGLMVKHIDEKGFIRFQPLGGLNAQAISSQRVVIHGRQAVHGVIVPDSRPDSREKVTPVDEAVIDTGLDRETLCQRIEVGDVVSFASELAVLNDKVYVGRNFDDRIGTYCLLAAMQRLEAAPVDVYAVSTVQEEVGVRGARTASFAVEPDIGIALDGSLTRGPYSKDYDKLCDVGKGTGIYIMDRLTIGDRRLVRFLFDVCEQAGVPYQKNIGGGTDASAIQKARRGSLSTTVGAPVRYMHSTVQLCHADDIEATVDLLVAFIARAHELIAQTA